MTSLVSKEFELRTLRILAITVWHTFLYTECARCRYSHSTGRAWRWGTRCRRAQLRLAISII